MLDSDVRPTRGRIEDARVTGKNKNAQQMFPIYPSLRDTLRNLASHLPKPILTDHLSLRKKHKLFRQPNILLISLRKRQNEGCKKWKSIYYFDGKNTAKKLLLIINYRDVSAYTFSPSLSMWRSPKLTYK